MTHDRTSQPPLSKPVVLLTGFGPFPDMPENVSGRLVHALSARARTAFPEYAFHANILETEWNSAPARVCALIEHHDPVLALHFGVAAGSETIRLERCAANVCRYAPDAAGLPPLAPLLIDGGAARHRVSIPLDAVYQRLLRSAVPVSFSDDAGGYLCNAVLYHSLSHEVASGRPRRSGFIHLPDDLSRPSLTFSVALNACLLVIEACLEEIAQSP